MRRAKDEGAAVLGDLARRALKRALAQGDTLDRGEFFTDEERQQLADALAAVCGTADLLGRSRIVRRLELHQQHGRKHHELDAFSCFDEAIRPFAPQRALDYFRSLIPKLGIDPERWGEGLKRHAFTLAVATEQTVLERVQKVIADVLETGEKVSAAPRTIAKILDQAGVSPRDPSYCDMVFRTNMRDAYMQGQQEQLAEVADSFPVWRYIGIDDGRQGKDHEPHFDKYYPTSAPFAEVRGPRVFNCRCDQLALHVDEWRELRASGARIAEGYTDPIS